MQRCFQSKYFGSNSAEGLHFSAFHFFRESNFQLHAQSLPGERSGNFSQNGKFDQNGKFSQNGMLVRKVRCI